MNTSVFNHSLNSVFEAMGLTEDQYDEIIFKTSQILKRLDDKSQSEQMAACIKWAFEKFDDDALRGAACLFMGQTIEKARMMSSIQGMLSGSRDGMLAKLREKMTGSSEGPEPFLRDAVRFSDSTNRDKFMKEFKDLIEEFNGEDVPEFGGAEGVMAVSLDPERKDEFHKRLELIKQKYGVKSDDDGIGAFMSFGGPVTEA